MHDDRPEARGIVRGQQRRHASTGRQPGYRDARAIGRIQNAHLIDHRHQRRCFSGRLAGSRFVPIPAALRMTDAILLRVKHQKAMARCQRVHASDSGKVSAGLAAAMQHDDQRELLARRQLQVSGAKQVVAPSAARAECHAGKPVALARRRLQLL